MNATDAKAARAQQRTSEMCEGGDTYAAVQMAMATVARARSPEVALATAFACAEPLLKHEAVNEAVTLVDTCLRARAPLSEASLVRLPALVEQLCSSIGRPAGAKTMPGLLLSPVQGEGLLAVVDRCVEAADSCSTVRAVASLDAVIPQLHRVGSEIARGCGALAKANEHYLLSGAPDRFSGFLVAWTAAALPSERPIILIRAILQLLAIGSLRDSVRCCKALEVRGVLPSPEDAEVASKAAAAAAAAGGGGASSEATATPSSPSCRCGGVEWSGAALCALNLTRYLQTACAKGKAGAVLVAALNKAYGGMLAGGSGPECFDSGEIGRLVSAAAHKFCGV